jgi:hypothetical protein
VAERVFEWAREAPISVIAVLLALAWALREAVPAIRAWKDKRRNGNGHTSPIRGFDLLPEPPERQALRDANPDKSGRHTDELRRDLKKLEHDECATEVDLALVRKELDQLVLLVTGREGLQERLAIMEETGKSTEKKVDALPEKLAAMMDAKETTRHQQLIRAMGGLKDAIARETDEKLRVLARETDAKIAALKPAGA